MIVLENKYGKVYYEAFHDATNEWLSTKWDGFLPTEAAIKGVETTLELLRKHNCNKLLSDNSKVKGAWSETNEWMKTNWYEPAAKIGLRKHATVLPGDIFSKISHENFEKGQKEDHIEMRSFDNIADAEKWLKEA